MIKFIDYFFWKDCNSSVFWIKGEGERTAIVVYPDGVPELDFNPPRMDIIELTPEQIKCRLRAHGLPEELIRRVECLSS